MKVSLLGPTNLEKFSAITGLSPLAIEEKAKVIGKAIAMAGHDLIVVYNYAGMLRLVGDAYRQAGGKLTMLVPTEDTEWDIPRYEDNVEHADIVVEREEWSDVLLSLVSDPDIVVCAGLSAGVFAELAYMKWNLQESRGAVQELIGLSDLLRDGVIPPELEVELQSILTYRTCDGLQDALS